MKKIFSYLIILTGLVSLSSCDKWLDVKPKSQVESEVAFKEEQGFKDALTGIYVGLTDNSLYGKELTYGMADVLGRQYTQLTGPYTQFNTYSYTNDTVKTRVNAVWNKMYKNIANANNLITNIKAADPALFTGTNQKVITGEALALRAFMHFDLLRLFAPAPASNGGSTAIAIPYVTTFGVESVSRGTVNEVITKLLGDLSAASLALKDADPIVSGSRVPSTSTGFLRNRTYKFNYYAVKALMARVYLYAGDKVNALAAAKEVIDSGVFPFVPSSAVISGADRVFVPELIFSLNINNLHTQAVTYFNADATSLLSRLESEYSSDFDNDVNDYRYIYGSGTTPGNFRRFPTKLLSSTLLANNFKMPVIRVSELYLIAAECLKESNPSAAADFINKVRTARNSRSSVSSTATPADIQTQVFKEYRREFVAEGQLFYYYKRLNVATIEYSGINAGNSIYVLPLPDDEIEYGAN
ncbi:RagB/SusD family nutrient uptake outer membrane protein [Desertivirga brevis]|uniref:RagB/SusD family nutrient uptake outer membrane protein n=1 Tax=Desertivirga brevis TaxID=2810310 RepID=UPI001A968531|nr:RagB/SusD family nutrient uptake outer membrane protein [Pedobacter sp. SYSU D00873]